jgi:CheY-like chemotaxis protein
MSMPKKVLYTGTCDPLPVSPGIIKVGEFGVASSCCSRRDMVSFCRETWGRDIMLEERKQALVVDDDESTREFVGEIMRRNGWDVVEAADGLTAIELATDEEPDIIILDIDMPEMDGFEAFRRLRTDPRTERIPVIMLTAINDLTPDEEFDEESVGERLGVEDPEGFVDKPVNPEFLMNVIFGVVG